METWNDIRHADILAPTEDSASVPMNDFSDVPSLSTNDEVVDMGTDFDFEGFQVVRREFFAHLHEPSVTFNNYKFYVNCACLNKFPEASFVQVLVNQETKIMALRPCVENARDSFAWIYLIQTLLVVTLVILICIYCWFYLRQKLLRRHN